jgi:hypothetical protein
MVYISCLETVIMIYNYILTRNIIDKLLNMDTTF